jgi:hypothetical protein
MDYGSVVHIGIGFLVKVLQDGMGFQDATAPGKVLRVQGGVEALANLGDALGTGLVGSLDLTKVGDEVLEDLSPCCGPDINKRISTEGGEYGSPEKRFARISVGLPCEGNGV